MLFRVRVFFLVFSCFYTCFPTLQDIDLKAILDFKVIGFTVKVRRFTVKGDRIYGKGEKIYGKGDIDNNDITCNCGDVFIFNITFTVNLYTYDKFNSCEI